MYYKLKLFLVNDLLNFIAILTNGKYDFCKVIGGGGGETSSVRPYPSYDATLNRDSVIRWAIPPDDAKVGLD
jgi:hypothetical protein